MDDFAGLIDDFDGEDHRLFDPRISQAHRMVPKAKLVVYDPARQILRLQMYIPGRDSVVNDPGNFVVYIDGACRDNGKPTARAAWGVYFGPGLRYNSYGLLDPDLPQTSSRAEIEALAQALDIIAAIIAKDYSLSMIKIASDSEYLVKAMSIWMDDWIDNDGINSCGQRVVHFDALKEIHERLDNMTYSDDGGMDFTFWSIPREENKEADKLANRAIDD